ncbi:MAG TPA: hypothetical protein VGS27_14555 [Candidatus Sulfotelmatobacter sp.]|nr:hypothetical protein [Candidatus Sulfotelmatobacter sp.]
MATETVSGMTVVTLDINEMGQMKKRLPRLAKEEQLENTLLQGLYDGIRVARLNVPPGKLEDYQENEVQKSMRSFEFEGVRYRLIGASASAKSGKFYAVDERYEPMIAERFRKWPEAAITYFGILVSPCKQRIQLSDARVMVVKDRTLGTNDCRGWISESLFERFHLPRHRLYQFRLAFENTQAKGACKVMPDDVAQKLGADIILPESCVKPEYKQSSRILDFFRWRRPKIEVRSYRGPAVFGIREISRKLDLHSSYTLIEHAPWVSIQTEIAPFAMEQACKLRAACQDGRYDEVIELLGTSHAQGPWEEGSDSEYTSLEHTVVEAVLKVDSSGYLIKHPYINNALNRLLAKWTFKLCTAGGFKIPGFALADDGFLSLYQGQVVAASDWLPQDRAISSLPCTKGLVVRYPIRMFEDLLPYTRVSTEEAVALITQAIEEQNGCSIDTKAAVDLVKKQIRLEGTLTLHSETAAKNGGDFDFDLVAVVEGERFPCFVESRFAHQDRHEKVKTKHNKKQSPWWNLALVANQAKGNQIGSITDLKTSCYAAGFQGEAYQLVDELQHALDSLKWGTEVNQELIAEIRKKVPPAPWLQLKDKERVSDMPVHLEVLTTDKIGWLYNLARKEVEDFFSAKLPIADFHGLISGEHFTKEMSQECRLVNRIYADEVGKLITEKQALDEALAKAEAEYGAKQNDPATRNEARTQRNAARSKVHAHKEHFREEFQALRSLVQAWGDGKKLNRRGWCQALHTIICAGKGNGSLLFHAFPQEIIDKVAEETGSNAVQVSVPDLVDGEIEFDEDGRVFLVEPFPSGDGTTHERKIFLLQISKKGEVLVDGKVVERVEPFPMQYGAGVIRDGKLVFNNIRQRPTVKRQPMNQSQPCTNDTGTVGGQGETPS